MKQRFKLWIVAILTCSVVLGLSYWFILSRTEEGFTLFIFPVLPCLVLIIGVFLYGIKLISSSYYRYESETKACKEVDDIISQFGTPLDIQYKLNAVTQGETTIGNRIAHSIQAADLSTATSILQIPQGMEVEENRTFSNLQFLRTALVLIGLFSTVLFFAMALTSADLERNDGLSKLMRELQSALTMTMAGVATSVVLGWRTSKLFGVQQNLKADIDEVTAKMLPRLLPRFEVGTREEPGPALILEKLSHLVNEIEEWKNQTGIEIQNLTGVLATHREVLANLPAVSLPDSFTKLNDNLSNVVQSMGETRDVTNQALQILSKERSLDLNAVISLLKEIRTDSERFKNAQDSILKDLIPKQNELLQSFSNVDKTLQLASNNMKESSDAQEKMVKSFETISTALDQVSLSINEKFSKGIRDLAITVENLNRETRETNRLLQDMARSRGRSYSDYEYESRNPPPPYRPWYKRVRDRFFG